MPFLDARLKIERANKHISDLEARVAGLENRVVVTVGINPKTGNEFIQYDLQDQTVVTDAALLIGDAVHNLRCALDYAWARTIQQAIPELANFSKFPVHPTLDSLQAALKGKRIDTACERLFTLLITRIRPYNEGNFAIWPVHQIDKGDKHRLLTTIIHYSSADNIQIQNETGETRNGFTMATMESFPHFLEFPRNWHVTNHGKPSTSLMFKYGNPPREFRPVDTLRIYSREIVEIVEVFEAFFETL